MSVLLIEKPLGEYCIINGEKRKLFSDAVKPWMERTDKTVYYESIRIKKGVPVFFEDHMLRLHRSIESSEDFPFDSQSVYEYIRMLTDDEDAPIKEGNLRVIVTNTDVIIHFSDMIAPKEDDYRKGVPTSTLVWERENPHIKTFRHLYKEAVANSMQKKTICGNPYEVLLLNGKGEITEGSRSNFFVLLNQTVYSPPEELILAGITRKYVYRAVCDAGLSTADRLFTVEELVALWEKGEKPIPFLTSSPFNILPISCVNDWKIPEKEDTILGNLIQSYQDILNHYIAFHSPEAGDMV